MRDPDAPLRARYDAVVVGARCAGAATALLLSRRGLRVLAVDRGAYGTDTLSTLALMRAGVLQLVRWGLLDRVTASGTPAVRATSFHYGADTIELPIKPRDGVDALYAPRRTVLDRVLVDAAGEAGAEVRHHTRLSGLLQAGRRVRGVVLETPGGDRRTIEADVVIGADGRQSAVASLVDAPATRTGLHAAGTVYAFWSGLETGAYRWHYADGVSAGVIPTNGDQCCVFAAMPPARFVEAARGRGVAALYEAVIREAAPPLAGRLGDACRTSPFHGFPGTPGYLRRSHGPGWALVGDAGYFKDPITAHGITDALRDAELLASAVVEGTPEALAGYEAERDVLSLPLFEITDAVASFAWTLEELKRLHLELSREMNREVARLAGPPAGQAPSAIV